MSLNQRLQLDLEKREHDNSLRELSNYRGLIDFCSNDYLGLARNKELHKRIQLQASEHEINGATGSRLLSGNHSLFEKTEEYLATIFKTETSVIFNSGYSANLALLSSIPKKNDQIIYDELAHACIKDGARLSLAKRYSFKHNDLSDLEHKLRLDSTGQKFIIIESVYSMDGDQCPLKEITELAEKYKANIIIDEAHTTGVIGDSGNGLTGALGLQDKVFATIYTFGKAMGIHGAAVACSKILKSYLINFARPFIYTTALPPHSVISIEEAFRFLSKNQKLQTISKQKISLFHELYKTKIGTKYIRIPSQHPVQSILIPGNDNAKLLSKKIVSRGFEVRPILSPTVKKGSERIRICIHTYNSDKEISSLIDTLAE